jgi:hypothetical protein
VRRFVQTTAVALLAATVPACLLYTDAINSAPQVMIVPPASVHANEQITFQASASDPDGDPLTLTWERVNRACADVTSDDWESGAERSKSETFQMQVAGHEPFCVRVVAEDRHGARTASKPFDGAPANRPPTMIKLGVDGATAAISAYPLYTTVRLAVSPLTDDDGDPVTFTWKAVDPGGVDRTKDLLACDPLQPESVRCFAAERSGPYTVSVDATDGLPGGNAPTASLILPVMEDAPPCIEVSDPSAETSAVVMAVTDPARRFEVRRVKDDGHPYPAGPRGGTTFHWFTASEDKPFRHELGYDFPTFEVGAARFDDARPGSWYRVRVEVRDPLREEPGELARLEATCQGSRLCEAPVGCVRSITWNVRFR